MGTQSTWGVLLLNSSRVEASKPFPYQGIT